MCFLAEHVPLRHQLDKNMFFALWLLHPLFLCVYLFSKGQMIGNLPVEASLCIVSLHVFWQHGRTLGVCEVQPCEERVFSRSDGMKRGVCASDELETRMRAAYDRVG